jgi:hypothetical protein
MRQVLFFWRCPSFSFTELDFWGWSSCLNRWTELMSWSRHEVHAVNHIFRFPAFGYITGMRDLCSSESRLLQGCHTLSSTRNGEDSALPEKNVDGGRHGVCQKPTPAQFTCQTMWSWFDPISPHLAAAKEGSTVSDLMVLNSVQSSLQSLSDDTLRIWEREDKCSDLMRKWALVETAGGVASPGPSGTLQCDLYRWRCHVFAEMAWMFGRTSPSIQTHSCCRFCHCFVFCPNVSARFQEFGLQKKTFYVSKVQNLMAWLTAGRYDCRVC